MEKVSQKDIDWLLNLNQTSATDHATGKSPQVKKVLLQLAAALFIFVGLIILPFLLLIRTSVILSTTYDFNGWFSLGVGIAVTTLLLSLYALILFRRVKNKRIFLRYCLSGCSILVLSFCMYGVFYLSSVHAKSEDIREVYRSLHPILRVAVATTTLADDELVITDIQRQPDDYAAMGLPTNHSSLHYKQANGYVHAIDLRTRDRWELRNFLLLVGFKSMGFQTIRHIGTADHLHVALPPRKH